MECEKIQPFLDGFAEGELSSSQVETIEEHLEGCASCRKELSAIRQTVGLLKEFGEVEEPEDFVEQVRKRIELRRRSSPALRLLGGGALRRVLVPAVSVMIAGLGIWMAYRHFSPAPKRVEEARAEDDSGSTRIARIDKTSDMPLPESTDSDDYDSLRLGKRGRAVMQDESLVETERIPAETVAPVIAALPDNGREKALLDIEGQVLAKSGPEGAFRDLPSQVPASATAPRGGTVSSAEQAVAAPSDSRGEAKGAERPAKEPRESTTGSGGSTFDYSRVDPDLRRTNKEEERPVRQGEKPLVGAGLTEQREAGTGEASIAGRDSELGVHSANGVFPDATPGGMQMPSPAVTAPSATQDLLREKDAAGKSGSSAGEPEGPAQPGIQGDFYTRQVDFEPIENGDLVRLFAMFPEWGSTGRLQQAESDSDSRMFGNLLLSNKDNVVRLNAKLDASPPELVLYVKDKAKALGEIRKAVTSLGGTIEEAAEKASEATQHRKEEDGVFTVSLKQGTYRRLRGQMREETQSAVVEKHIGEGVAVQGGDIADGRRITTLRIRVIQVTEEKPASTSPQN
jgi:hypothetical protein